MTWFHQMFLDAKLFWWFSPFHAPVNLPYNYILINLTWNRLVLAVCVLPICRLFHENGHLERVQLWRFPCSLTQNIHSWLPRSQPQRLDHGDGFGLAVTEPWPKKSGAVHIWGEVAVTGKCEANWEQSHPSKCTNLSKNNGITYSEKCNFWLINVLHKYYNS